MTGPSTMAHHNELHERIRALEAELAEYRGLVDGDVDEAWRKLQAERDALKEELDALKVVLEGWKDHDALKARVAELEEPRCDWTPLGRLREVHPNAFKEGRR